MESVLKFQPDWDDPTSKALYENKRMQTRGYAPFGSWAFARVGDFDNAIKGAINIHDATRKVNKAWPYECAIAGELILALSGGYGGY